MNLDPPPTRVGCSNLLDYIFKGNCTIGEDVSARIAITKSYQEKWIGKKVRANFGESLEGEVRWLGARTVEDVADIRAAVGPRNIHPFKAMVHFPSISQTSFCPLSSLELIDDLVAV